MSRKVILTISLIASLSLTGCSSFETATAAKNTNNQVFKVALIPGEPIFYGHDKNDTINSINEHKVDFSIFNGDSKDGATQCSNNAIGEHVMDYFKRLHNSVLYSVGDNEWTDCHRANDGSYNPIERLSYIRKIFFSKPTTQGNNALSVERQGKLGQAYSENSRFVKNSVMFVALHIPGSNNNFVSTPSLCSRYSTRTQEDCDLQTKEYVARNAKNLQWLQSSFAKAKKEKLAGIVINIQADPYFAFKMSGGRYKNDFLVSLDPTINGYADFFHELIKQTDSFHGQVLLNHSDSHYFKLDKAMLDKSGAIISNFTRVENFGGIEQSWIEMTVNPNSKNVFSFQPIILNSLIKSTQ